MGATLVWTTFAGWFFGPSLFQRIGALSGMQCVVVLPPESADAPHTQTILSIPAQFCSTKTPISPATHPALFAHPPLSLDAAEAHFPRMPVWRGDLKGFVPRFYRGHDVSGHTFLLTLSVLFLVDHLVRARRLRVGARGTAVQSGNEWTPLRLLGLIGGWALVGLWMVMLGATAVYFHTWEEKLSGFRESAVPFLCPGDDSLLTEAPMAYGNLCVHSDSGCRLRHLTIPLRRSADPDSSRRPAGRYHQDRLKDTWLLPIQ